MSGKRFPLLLETIKIDNGTVYNLQYHQKRCNSSREKLFLSKNILDLSKLLSPPKSGLYRCRILYAEKVNSIEYIPYTPKEINKLKIVPSTLNYDFKYAERTLLENLLNNNPQSDEVIIEKEGYLTDTTISNIAFYDGKRWETPLHPLLKGTMRQKLIEEGHLHQKNIKKEDLHKYKQVALINAMLGFKILNGFTIT